MLENNPSHDKTPETICLDFILKEAGDSPEFIVDLLETFLYSLRDHIIVLENIHQTGDTEHLYVTVHKLKPSLKMFSLNTSLKQVFTIEEAIHDQLPTIDLLRIAATLQHTLHPVEEQLLALIRSYKTTL